MLHTASRYTISQINNEIVYSRNSRLASSCHYLLSSLCVVVQRYRHFAQVHLLSPGSPLSAGWITESVAASHCRVAAHPLLCPHGERSPKKRQGRVPRLLASSPSPAAPSAPSPLLVALLPPGLLLHPAGPCLAVRRLQAPGRLPYTGPAAAGRHAGAD